ncbi:MAG TPA: helix-turn-helix transcriptional regulator [Thermoanaerobaculia bacterium]|nr:helix-turn-helix transcriptional regulator [Thermoanaerobaculia bacterium]
MPSTTHPADKEPAKGVRRASVTPLRKIRMQRGLTQTALAELSGMHRNSIRKIETGLTREITAANADALASALKISVDDLGLRVRSAEEPPSIRLRRLTAEQRQILDEVLSLPPQDYAIVKAAIDELRRRRGRKPRRGEKR